MIHFKNKITDFARLAIMLLVSLMLVSCSPVPTPTPTAATSSLVVAKVDAAASPAIAVITDNTGKEKIALIGTKDSSGAPISVTQALYISASGEAGTITMGADGLPASLSDAVGNKITSTNFTDNTMDITQFDPAGNKVAGPVTVNVDPTVLAKLRANAVTLASSSTQGTPLVAGVFSGISTQDWVDIGAKNVGTAFGLYGCATTIFAGLATAVPVVGEVVAPVTIPLFALNAAACVSTLVKAATEISEINRPTYITAADDTAGVGADCLAKWEPVGCAINIATVIVPLTFNVTAPPPTVPTGLTLSKVQGNQVIFYWTGSSGGYARLTAYSVYRDGSKINDNWGTIYVDTNVIPGQQYRYTVAANDENGKSSLESAPLYVTIPVTTLFMSATTPVSGTSGALVSSAVFATFNETIDASTLNPLTFTVTGPSGLVTGTVSYNATTQSAVFMPLANFDYAATYTATVTTGVKDLSGNPLASNYSWNFTTGSNSTVITPPVTPPPTPTPSPPPTAGVPTPFTLSAVPQCSGLLPQIMLSGWGSSGFTTFDLNRNGVLYSPANTGPTFLNTAVTAGTTYSYSVTAKNASGSTTSTTISVTAPTCSVIAPPPTPTPSPVPTPFTLSATPECIGTSPRIVLSGWGSSGFTTFDLNRNGALLFPANTGTTFSNSSVVAGTTYTYSVTAKNASGSTTSPTISVTAPICAVTPPPVAPPVVPSLVVNGVLINYTGIGQKTIPLTGSGLLSITQISWSCTKPGGTSCGVIPSWIPGTARWGNVTLTSNTAATIFPTFLVASDPPGTYNWSVTFLGGGQSVIKHFTATK